MEMKKICVSGMGGGAGIGLTRCLKLDPTLDVQGYDSSLWGELAAECPVIDDPYLADMIIPVPDALVAKYAGADLCFLPSKEVVELCQDKAKCAEVLGDLAPKTFWVRDTHGAGGAGAQMASEFLPGRNYSVELVYTKDKLLWFIKERLAYDIKGRKDPLWQRGSSVVSRCIADSRLLDKAIQAVACIYAEFKDESDPKGVFAIDFKEDENGVPKITEINPGRFLTASYTYFYSCGYNLPLAMVKAFFNEPYELGEYPEGKTVIRQTDSLPKFI